MAKEKKYPPIEPTLPIRRVSFLFASIIWLGSLFQRILYKGKVKKYGKLPKPPFLLLSTHASMMDFYMALTITCPRRVYWVSTVEEFIHRYFIFRRIGVLAKRKFTNDPISAKKYLEVLQKGKILTIFPEARYSLVGENERLDKGLGRFVKTANVPVVLIKGHGNYLYCPQWSDRKPRKISPILTEVETIVNRYELDSMSPQDIQDRIEENFYISEDEWMKKNHIINSYEHRAVGLERILYKCPHCGTEFEMSSQTHFLKCNHCGKTYDYLENGQLRCINGETIHDWPSKWYKWEKECVKQEVIDGTYHFEDEVRVEKLIGAKIGFVPLEGRYKLTHDINEGIIAKGIDNDFEFKRSSMQSFGLHIEFNYEDKGAFLELSDVNTTYFVYPLTQADHLTKMHFATEHIYDYLKGKLKEENE